MYLSWCAPALAADDALLDTMKAEIDRARTALAASPAAPYHLSAEVVDVESVTLKAEDGALHGVNRDRARSVDVDVRLGSPEVDSTHALRDNRDSGTHEARGLPLGDDPQVFARELWKALDAGYKRAAERWGKVRGEAGALVGEEKAWDLAPTTPAQELGPPATLTLDEAAWTDTLRRASAVLGANTVALDGAVSFTARATTTRFASSEGAMLRHGRVDYTLAVALGTVADDGARLDLGTIWQGVRLDDLPTAAALEAELRELSATLAALRTAPEQEPYTGPVVLGGDAAAVFFHEVFGHRVEGHRLKRVDNAQTFRSRVGQPILPGFLDVHDDPTLERVGEVALNGAYRYDNQGVPAQRVTLVDDGVLRGFLQGRDTTTAADRSNGHGRRQAGKAAVTRQGNLVVSASTTVPEAQLVERLRAAARARGLPYGLWIDRIRGGFTYTERAVPNAFQVDVVVARRVWVDGRPDELVRGIDLIGTPLDAFGSIVAAGDRVEVFNGVCGAESGWVPVSAVSPAMLVAQLETQKKKKGQARPPLLPPPLVEAR